MTLNKEPTVIIGGFAEIVRAIVPMLLIFGVVHWTDAQTGTVIFLVGVLVSVAEKWFVRQQVVPVGVRDSQIEKAVSMPEGTSVGAVIRAEARETKQEAKEDAAAK